MVESAGVTNGNELIESLLKKEICKKHGSSSGNTTSRDNSTNKHANQTFDHTILKNSEGRTIPSSNERVPNDDNRKQAETIKKQNLKISELQTRVQELEQNIKKVKQDAKLQMEDMTKR